MMKNFYLIACLVFVGTTACVSKKKYNDELRRRLEVEDRNLQYTAEVRAVGQRSDRINATIASLEAELEQTRTDAQARIARLERQILALRGEQADTRQRDGITIANLRDQLSAAEQRLAAIERAEAQRRARQADWSERLTTTLTGYPAGELAIVAQPDAVRLDVAADLLFRDGNYGRVRTDGKQLLTALSFALQGAEIPSYVLEGTAADINVAQRLAAGVGAHLTDELGWSPANLRYQARALPPLPAEKSIAGEVLGERVSLLLVLE